MPLYIIDIKKIIGLYNGILPNWLQAIPNSNNDLWVVRLAGM